MDILLSADEWQLVLTHLIFYHNDYQGLGMSYH